MFFAPGKRRPPFSRPLESLHKLRATQQSASVDNQVKQVPLGKGVADWRANPEGLIQDG
jgi:hypothetical protein